MATLSSLVSGSGGGFLDGPRNTTVMWNQAGSYTWTVPSNFDVFTKLDIEISRAIWNFKDKLIIS